MNIKKVGIPAILPDNDMYYLSHIIKTLSSIDDEASLVISKSISGYGFTLRHSDERFKDSLLDSIREVHRALGLEVEFSSFRHSPFITFRLLAR